MLYHVTKSSESSPFACATLLPHSSILQISFEFATCMIERVEESISIEKRNESLEMKVGRITGVHLYCTIKGMKRRDGKEKERRRKEKRKERKNLIYIFK